MNSNTTKFSDKHCGDDINARLAANFRSIGHTLRSMREGRGSQTHILVMLTKNDGLTQSALTEMLGIQPGSASEVLAKLDSAGLITRSVNASDKRTSDIHLTDNGRKKAEEAVMQRHKRQERMFTCLSDSEKQQLLSLLEKLNSAWDEEFPDERKRRGGHLRGHGKARSGEASSRSDS